MARGRTSWGKPAAALAAAGALLVPAVASAAGVGGFSVRPSHFTADPASRAYFIEPVGGGQVVHDSAVVSNDSSTPVTLRVYPVDGLTGVTSGAVYGNEHDALRKAGRWVSVARRTLALGPHSSATVPFTLRIPRGAAAGDHLAGLALENARPQRSRGRFSIVEVIRDVVGIEMEVRGPAHQAGVLRGIALKALPGTHVASAVVSLGDAGGKLCKPALAVTLTPAAGGTPVTVRRRLDTVLPGDTIPFPLPWPHDIAAGGYRASASLADCGPTAHLAQSVSLGTALQGTTTPPAARASAATPLWAIAAAVAGGVLAGGALLLGGIWLVRRRRRRDGWPGLPEY